MDMPTCAFFPLYKSLKIYRSFNTCAFLPLYKSLKIGLLKLYFEKLTFVTKFLFLTLQVWNQTCDYQYSITSGVYRNSEYLLKEGAYRLRRPLLVK